MQILFSDQYDFTQKFWQAYIQCESVEDFSSLIYTLLEIPLNLFYTLNMDAALLNIYTTVPESFDYFFTQYPHSEKALILSATLSKFKKMSAEEQQKKASEIKGGAFMNFTVIRD